ncbi:MAG: hypothetical protein ACRECH_02845 [Nitrososphaerales archaeon]
MVLVILNTLKFEAEKFETRTMPTPDMKSKEVIYWIKVNTPDKRLVADLQRFLEGASQFVELHVPSAFIAVKTEIESYRPSGMMGVKRRERIPRIDMTSSAVEAKDHEDNEGTKQRVEEKFLVEIILRRVLPESRSGQTQSPYG